MASKKTSVRTPKSDKRGKHPNSRANLAPPFPKGVSGNPGGRPRLLGDSYKAMLARVNESDPQGRTNAELIANAALIAALGGDVSAMREIRSATEGEQLKHSGELNVSGGFAVKPVDYAIAIAALAPGPVDDREPSGTNQDTGDGAALG